MISRRLLAVCSAAILFAAGATVAAAAPGDIEPRIVGGTTVAPGEYPFVAAVVWHGIGNAHTGLRCGGTLIDERWVLTAAHCVDGYDGPEFDVVVGRTVLTSGDGERIRVQEAHTHPGWDDVTFENDAALLELAEPATAGEAIHWATGTLEAWFAPETAATVAGWGTTENKPAGTGFGVQDAMRQADVPIRYDGECDAAVPAGEYFPGVMLCAGFPEGGVDACLGDSGGPLFVPEADRFRQVGIVSWGYGCADAEAYGYYTRLASFDDWIVATTGLTTCEGAPATVIGSAGDDFLTGTSGTDVIVGLGGDDTLRAWGGHDIVCGGGGDDIVAGGPGDDLLFGGPGRDQVLGSGGDDYLFGGTRRDRIKGGDGDDWVLAGGGNDVVRGHDGADVISTDGGGDLVYGGEGADVIAAGGGDDTIYGESGADTIQGDAGDDVIRGQEGDDTLRGRSGNDQVHGGDGDDTVDGGGGADTITGDAGIDVCRRGEIDLSGCETVV